MTLSLFAQMRAVRQRMQGAGLYCIEHVGYRKYVPILDETPQPSIGKFFENESSRVDSGRALTCNAKEGSSREVYTLGRGTADSCD